MPFFIFHILKTKTSTRAKLASLLQLLSCQYGSSFNRPLLKESIHHLIYGASGFLLKRCYQDALNFFQFPMTDRAMTFFLFTI